MPFAEDNTSTSVLIVETDFRLRDCYQVIVNTSGEFHVCGCYASIAEALPYLLRKNPELVIVGKMPSEENTFQFANLLRRHLPDAQLLSVDDTLSEENLLALISCGVVGVLQNRVTPEVLVGALREIKNGGAVLERALSRYLVSHYQQDYPRRLSRAEISVLNQLSLAKTKVQIAQHLGVTIGTVSSQLHSIYRKLNVHSRREAIRSGASYLRHSELHEVVLSRL